MASPRSRWSASSCSRPIAPSCRATGSRSPTTRPPTRSGRACWSTTPAAASRPLPGARNTVVPSTTAATARSPSRSTARAARTRAGLVLFGNAGTVEVEGAIIEGRHAAPRQIRTRRPPPALYPSLRWPTSTPCSRTRARWSASSWDAGGRARAARPGRSCAHQGVVGAGDRAGAGRRRRRRAQPRLRPLGVELKTVPVTAALVPIESTAVCQIDPVAIAAKPNGRPATSATSWRACCSSRSRCRRARASVGDRRVAAVGCGRRRATRRTRCAPTSSCSCATISAAAAPTTSPATWACAAGSPQGPRRHRHARRLRRRRPPNAHRQIGFFCARRSSADPRRLQRP